MKLLNRNIIAFGSFSRRAEVIWQKEIAYYFVIFPGKQYMIYDCMILLFGFPLENCLTASFSIRII